MARNDGMDALIGLGILGAMLDGGNTPKNTFGKSTVPAQDKKLTLAECARKMKEIYDAYVEAGFTEAQAFELLKVVMTR